MAFNVVPVVPMVSSCSRRVRPLQTGHAGEPFGQNRTAKPFQDWVTRDVLPAIRKTGAYVKGEEALKQGKPLPEDTMKAMEDRLNAKFEQLFTMNQQLIQANHGLKEDVTRKQFVIEEMHDKVNTLAEDKAAGERQGWSLIPVERHV